MTEETFGEAVDRVQTELKVIADKYGIPGLLVAGDRLKAEVAARRDEALAEAWVDNDVTIRETNPDVTFIHGEGKVID